MTLKEHLENHNLKATKDQRSQIGKLLSKIDDTTNRVLEDGWNVKDYDNSFLNDIKTSDIIINHLSK